MEKPHRAVIAGANGFIGQFLSAHLIAQGWQVCGLVRKIPAEPVDGVSYQLWKGQSLGEWTSQLEGADLLVNLVGRSVNCRFTAENRQQILNSRIQSTQLLAESINQLEMPPKLWVNASGISGYAQNGAPGNDESAALDGEGFLAEVVRQWEDALFSAEIPSSVRRIAMRTGVVFGNHPGSAWTKLTQLARLMLGGPVGSGKQGVSWIAIGDYCRALEHLFHQQQLAGPVNFTSPNPLSNAEMMAAIRQLENRPFGAPAFSWMIHLAAPIVGIDPSLVLDSYWCLPAKLQTSGFTFERENVSQMGQK